MTPEELGMTQAELLSAQQAVETSFPIADLYDELFRVVSAGTLEDHTKLSKLDLKEAITASRNLSIKYGMLPRYDVFHNVFVFVRLRLDKRIGSYSVLMAQWSRNYKKVIPLYNFVGVL